MRLRKLGRALGLQIPSPLQQVQSPLLTRKGVSLFVKRDDLIHPLLSGNKWRKLKYNIIEAKRQGKTTLLSFGGAYSNHIHALAAAGKLLGFRTIGIIRGEKPSRLSPTLQFAQAQGMELRFISRAEYREKKRQACQEHWQAEFPDAYILPEGGSNVAALPGCAEIIAEIDQQLGYSRYIIAAPVGSGGTVAGLLKAKPSPEVLGCAVLKNGEFLREDIASLLQRSVEDFVLLTRYHCGGYAKAPDYLLEFIRQFRQEFGIVLEPVYSGKLFYALFDLIENDYFAPETSLVALHTGGLQGLAGFGMTNEKL